MKIEELREKAINEGDFRRYVKESMNSSNYLASQIYNSVGIEGNTISEGDTYTLLMGVENLSDSYTLNEMNEVKDLGKAVKVLYDSIEDNADLEIDLILELHSNAMVSDINSNPGEFKINDNYTTFNGAKKYYTPADEVEYELVACVDKYNTSDRTLYDISELLVKFINIHPFRDGNGRVHRLLVNWVLVTNNYPPIIIEKNDRDDYIIPLHENDIEGFLEFIERKLRVAYSDMLSETNKTNRF